jgi:hypothetical protein
MVQMAKVAEIAAAWRRAGEPYCDHGRKDKEYGLGSSTGDWACLDCGRTWPVGTATPPPEGSPKP